MGEPFCEYFLMLSGSRLGLFSDVHTASKTVGRQTGSACRSSQCDHHNMIRHKIKDCGLSDGSKGISRREILD